MLSWSQGDLPEVGGAHGAKYISLQGIAKVDDQPNKSWVGNEYVCNKLGLALGLPLPPGVLVRLDSGDLGFASLILGPFPPVIPPTFVADFEQTAAGVVAFDLWIGNDDRHEGNLAGSRARGIPDLIFDHDSALEMFRSAFDVLPSRATDLMVSPTSHCLCPEVSSANDLDAWADRILGLDERAITRPAQDLVEVGYWSKAERNAVVEFLVRRRTELRQLLRQLLPDLNWGMV